MEQRRGAAPADFQRKVQQRIKRQDRRFVLGNILTVIAFLGMLIFAVYMRHQSTWMGTGWVDKHLRLSFRSGRSSDMGFAANVAS